MQKADKFPFSRYLNIRSAYGPSFSPDGRHVAFLTDITGVPQVWRVAADGGWPDQLTFFSERCGFVAYSPTEDQMVFGMDAGGNERQQLFLLSGDGQTIRPLTGEPEAIHHFGGWSHDGRRIAWTANRRDVRHFDVYVQEVTSGQATCVWQTEGMNTVAGWSPDDRQLLVVRAHSSFDQDLYLLDLPSGEVCHLTPHEGQVRYESVRWATHGRGLYLVTDRGREFLALAYLDLTAAKAGSHAPLRLLVTPDSYGSLRRTVKPAALPPDLAIQHEHIAGEWDVEALALSPDGRHLAYLTNVEGYSELAVLDVASGRSLPLPALPGGVLDPPYLYRWGWRLTFSRDGRKLALTFSSPRHNPDVWVVDLEAGTAMQLTRSSRAGIPQDSFAEPELVRYRSFDGLEIPAFLYLPPGAARDGRLPVIVEVHGGPEAQRRPDFNPLYQYFIHRGYAIFAPNVRGSTGYGLTYTHLDDVEKRMDSVADLAYGARWLADSGVADPQRIAVMGGSYGGFMVLAALTAYPDLWAAGVDIVGIANFVTFLENTGPWRRHLREAEYGSLAHHRAFLESISPIHHVDKIRAPLMVIHGANDPRVPLGEAEQIVEALRARGVPVEYLRYEDEGHGLVKLKNRLDAYPKVADFLDRHLGQ
ncbi:MAG: S9 family peptidase [Anaerolineae bacterium]|nr:S9 family peptidase [Anaerolineae bacterium]